MKNSFFTLYCKKVKLLWLKLNKLFFDLFTIDDIKLIAMNEINFNNEIITLQSSLTRYAYSLTLDSDDAKDLVQETFYKALNNKDKFDSQTNIKAWLYTIMKNTFINNYRRRVKKQAIFNKDVQEFVLTSKPTDTNPESDFNYRELTILVNSLEPEFKIPFQMHDSGYKYQEIADELGLHLGTVKSRIHFCRQKLIEKLKK